MSSTECSLSCLLRESSFDDSYYNLAQTIYLAVAEWFPKATNIWATGHSLGGALAGLVAITNGIPAFAFEAPGDLMYASRIGLLPTGIEIDSFLEALPIYHFGNVNDPIYTGTCTGVTSSCYWFDYALESKCHIGKECKIDSEVGIYGEINLPPKKVIENLKSSLLLSYQDDEFSQEFAGDTMQIESIRWHSIEFVIKTYLENAKSVPECRFKPGCLATECPLWKFT